MIYVKLIEKIFGTKARVNTVLFLAKNEGLWSSNMLSKKIGMSQRAVLLALRELEEFGIVEYVDLLDSKGFRLIKDNWFYKYIVEPMLKKESKFFASIKEHFFSNLSDFEDKIISIFISKEKIYIILSSGSSADEKAQIDEIVRYVVMKDFKLKFGIEPSYEVLRETMLDESFTSKNFILLYGEKPEKIIAKNRAKKKSLKKALEFFGEG